MKIYKRKRRNKFREYKKAVKGKHNRNLYEEIFINYHKEAIQ